jgi:hypothetical protein
MELHRRLGHDLLELVGGQPVERWPVGEESSRFAGAGVQRDLLKSRVSTGDPERVRGHERIDRSVRHVVEQICLPEGSFLG